MALAALNACGDTDPDWQSGAGAVSAEVPNGVTTAQVTAPTDTNGATDADRVRLSAVADQAESPGVPSSSIAVDETLGEIDVYLNADSVTTNDTLTLHLSDNAGVVGVTRQAQVAIHRIGPVDEQVYSGTAGMTRQILPANAWVDCCNWPVASSIQIPTTWRSGLYRVTVLSPAGASTRAHFVVRAAARGSTSRVVLQVPFETAHAYSNWGGKSLYPFNSTDGQAATSISTFRPTGVTQDDDFIRWVYPLIHWAESQSIDLEYLSSSDLNSTPGVLNPYRLFITAGHDEYWSPARRTALSDFVAGGGNAAIFSGNTMWWKIALSADGFGRAQGRLQATKVPGSSTSNWYEVQPEAALLGNSWFKGGYVDELANPALTDIGFSVHVPEHYAFLGMGLYKNSVLGRAERILRYEADGIDFKLDGGGRPIPTGGDGAPTHTIILATVPLIGWDTMAYTTPNSPNLNLTGVPGAHAAITSHSGPNGAGTVFNGGTTDWTRALQACVAGGNAASQICTITRNVITRLSSTVANSAPVITPPGAQSSQVGTSVSLQITGTDADRDPLIFSAVNLPDGLSISPAGLITGSPAIGASSTTALITVSDGLGGAATVQVAWTITGVPGGQVATMVSPTPGSQLAGSGSTTFSWTPGSGDYFCFSIDSPGFPTLFAQCSTATSAQVTGLPQRGETLRVSLQTRIGLVWQPGVVYTYTAANNSGDPIARMILPAPDSVLTPGPTTTFSWTPGNGDLYCLSIDSPGLPSLYAECTTATSLVVPGLPENGERLMVSLQTRANLVWQPPQGYRYTAAGGSSSAVATMITPAPNTTLGTGTITFNWTDPGGDLYCLSVELPPVTSIFAQCMTGTSAQVSGIPTNGETIVVNLLTRQNLVWQPAVKYQYRAPGGP